MIRYKIKFVIIIIIFRVLHKNLTMARSTNLEVDVLLHASTKQKIDDIPCNTDDPLNNTSKKTSSRDMPDSTFIPEEIP